MSFHKGRNKTTTSKPGHDDITFEYHVPCLSSHLTLFYLSPQRASRPLSLLLLLEEPNPISTFFQLGTFTRFPDLHIFSPS